MVALGVKINLVPLVDQVVVADQVEQVLHLLVVLELLVKEIMVVITGLQYLVHLQLEVAVVQEPLEEVLQTTIIRVLVEPVRLHL